MLVIIKKAPETPEAKRGLQIAKDISAKLVLIQNGVYLARKGGLDGFAGSVYAIDEDIRLRGSLEIDDRVKSIGYDELVELMAEDEKVIGMF